MPKVLPGVKVEKMGMTLDFVGAPPLETLYEMTPSYVLRLPNSGGRYQPSVKIANYNYAPYFWGYRPISGSLE